MTGKSWRWVSSYFIFQTWLYWPIVKALVKVIWRWCFIKIAWTWNHLCKLSLCSVKLAIKSHHKCSSHWLCHVASKSTDFAQLPCARHNEWRLCICLLQNCVIFFIEASQMKYAESFSEVSFPTFRILVWGLASMQELNIQIRLKKFFTRHHSCILYTMI